uniref:Uncharacterized protein n=1 Tax=Romanomermis culicivorax TaxID=13658 RepID=A0A915KM35_ROMCU
CILKTCEALDSLWSEWSPCSQTCGESVKKRVRRCTSRDGQQCKDLLTEELRCPKQRSCPDDNGWSEWSSWAPCSSSCGSGRRSRSRSCDNGQCDGSTIESSPCLIKLCSRIPAGEWKQWSEWDRCSSSCGFQGLRSRSRLCSTFLCDGNSTEYEKCPDVRCPESTDGDFGTWDQWELWSECSKSCGGGPVQSLKRPEWSIWSQWSTCNCDSRRRIRRRMCQIFEPKLMGFCIGPVFEEQACQADSCESVNGQWSNWSHWSACSSECSSRSYRLRNRLCSDPQPSNRGSYCSGPSFERQDCSWLNGCSNGPVNGNWSSWTSWSECSSKCNGQRTRSRFCDNPPASQNGDLCSGPDFDFQQCANGPECR